MNKVEMKRILVNKFQEECRSFRSRDIKIDGNTIIIKDYEHIRFEIEWETDDYLGRICYIYESYRCSDGEWSTYRDCVAFEDSKVKSDDEILKLALRDLGYHIAQTF